MEASQRDRRCGGRPRREGDGPPGEGDGLRRQGVDPLPPYTVRVSARARRVRLVMSPAEGLVVVVPRGFALPRIPQVVAEHAAWIRRARRRLEQQARRAGALPDAALDADDGLPRWLLLRALGEAWAVGVDAARGRPAATDGLADARSVPAGLTLAGQVWIPAPLVRRGPVGWAPFLRRWLAGRARAGLLPWLERLARERGFRLAGSSVGCPKTRWGSCSAAGHVRLSLKLLFLPPELVEHVLIHELCHTVHLHHGPAFWRLVHRHDPRAAEHRRRLRGAWSYVPGWLRPARSIGPSAADRGMGRPLP
ncbi:DUF45 domain-containing protein [Thermaerobacter sp. FW80]|uniref:YgjP-like metallopeptidase domain-containing protein n=1 Tax=Thermaerobacter sp. FW80 TaxID=2546351 RepID=UPI0010756D80|nr:YgjP-like metallopeptidase domain-containing protein [Thermaerobacter sp. FW80]QBS38055.1 DUF45 domain-containing protein [Thermaerobacter sp. FW80]